MVTTERIKHLKLHTITNPEATQYTCIIVHTFYKMGSLLVLQEEMQSICSFLEMREVEFS